MSTLPLSPEARRLRSKIASTKRDRPDSPELPNLRRDFEAQKLADHVQAALRSAPPLTDEQRNRITALLRAGVDNSVSKGAA